MSEQTLERKLDLQMEQEIEAHYTRNAIMNFLDGVAFWFGMGFLGMQTIVPIYLSKLTDNPLLFGLLATISSAGWFLPQLLTAHWTQRLPRKKFAPVNVGFFTERLPVLLLAASTLLAVRNRSLALVALMGLMIWYTVGSGAVAVGWQGMLAKVIPDDRRGKLFGVTNTVGMGLGALSGLAAARLLARHSFPINYTLTFSASAVFMLLSWLALVFVHEPAEAVPAKTQTDQGDFWRNLRAVLKSDSNFVRYLTSQVITTGGAMAFGFLAVYAAQRWNLPDSVAGGFAVCQQVSQALSNIAFGVLADRHGHKIVLELGTLAAVLAMGLAILAPGPILFYAVIALAGISFAATYQSGLMIALEFNTAQHRPTYIGLNNTVRGMAAALTPILAGGLVKLINYRGLFAVALVVGLAGLWYLRSRVREPRT